MPDGNTPGTRSGPAGDPPPGARVLDPVFGDPVTVPDRTFRKIGRDHPELAGITRADLLAAVRDAEAHADDVRRPNRHLYYRRGATSWLAVVVEYDRGVGEAFNAYPVERPRPDARRL